MLPRCPRHGSLGVHLFLSVSFGGSISGRGLVGRLGCVGASRRLAGRRSADESVLVESWSSSGLLTGGSSYSLGWGPPVIS